MITAKHHWMNKNYGWGGKLDSHFYLFNLFNSIISFSWNSHLFRLDINNDQDRIWDIATTPPKKYIYYHKNEPHTHTHIYKEREREIQNILQTHQTSCWCYRVQSIFDWSKQQDIEHEGLKLVLKTENNIHTHIRIYIRTHDTVTWIASCKNFSS